MKHTFFLLLLCMMLPAWTPVYGQACFKAYDARSGQEISVFCVGTPVRFKSCNPNSRPDLEYYDFDRDNGIQIDRDTTKIHTYTAPGTYTVTQVINTGAQGVHQGTRTFTVLPMPEPRFQATGCSLGNVKVTITDQHYDVFEVRFGNSAPQTLPRGGSASYQFAPGQPMQVRVTGRYNQGLCANTAEMLLQERPLPPAPQLRQVQVLVPAAAGRLSFTLGQTRPDYYYLIEKQQGAGFTVLDTIKNPVTAELTRVLNQVNTSGQGCYRIRATDPCGSNLPVTSATVCSLPLQLSADQRITLSWPAYPQAGLFTGYQLYRDGKLYRTLPPGQTAFTDEKVNCQQQNCYELVVVLNNGARSVSNNPCATITTSPPPALPRLASTFTADNRVRLLLQVPAHQALQEVTYQKSTGGGAFAQLGSSKSATYEDKAFDKSRLGCYQAFYQDSCQQTSAPSNQTCPIVLTVTPDEKNTVALSWTDYVGFPAAPQYVVEKLDAGGQLLASTPVSGLSYHDTRAADAGQRLFYRIRGLSPGQEPTFSNTESVAFAASIQAPNAFTPNGDNLNDVFEVKGRFMRVTRLRLYDRWGQVIYQSQGQGWDGRIGGRPAPPGTYPYSVEWIDENGRQYSKTGVVSLLR